MDATSEYQTFRYSEAGGQELLGDLAGGVLFASQSAVSDDGSIVVGLGTSASGMDGFRWTVAAGMVGLDDFTGGNFESQADALSAGTSVDRRLRNSDDRPGGGDSGFLRAHRKAQRRAGQPWCCDSIRLDLGLGDWNHGEWLGGLRLRQRNELLWRARGLVGALLLALSRSAPIPKGHGNSRYIP